MITIESASSLKLIFSNDLSIPNAFIYLTEASDVVLDASDISAKFGPIYFWHSLKMIGKDLHLHEQISPLAQGDESNFKTAGYQTTSTLMIQSTMLHLASEAHLMAAFVSLYASSTLTAE